MRIAIRRSALAAMAMTMAMAVPGCTEPPDPNVCPAPIAHRSCAVFDRPPHKPPASEDDAGLDTDQDSGLEDDAGVDTAGAAPRPLATHPILVDELVNARDLGGMPLANDTRVAYGALFRGPPLLLSPTGCEEFAALGIRTIIDLRTEAESKLTPNTPCAVEIANLIAAPLPVPYNVSPEDYLTDLDTEDSIVAVFDVLGDDAAYPVYFHCTWGRDRTGIVGAVIYLALGAAREDVMREYLLSLPTVGAYPRSLDAVFDEIDRRGGVEAYLAAFGISARQVATLRAHALPPIDR